MNRKELYLKSIEIIKNGQYESGGYIACPTFPTYNYCWFRDSSYISYAMDLAGEHDSSAEFHHWAIENILKRKTDINEFLDGKNLNFEDVLHTRYTLSGEEGHEQWENFQLDSFGIWLWSLEEHLKITGNQFTDKMKLAVSLVSSYLAALWQEPCYDSWEENNEKRHIYTIATIYRGLQSAENLTGLNYSEICHEIKNWIMTKGCNNGHLSKFEGSDAVDSNLLGVYFPGQILDINHPVMKKTMNKIQEDLYKSGGLHRYKLDTYYGGGIWILLTAWLGICLFDSGDKEEAEKILNWIISKTDNNGYLAEQYTDSMNDESYLPVWIKKWGPSANPLLWSHAMYIILYNKIVNE